MDDSDIKPKSVFSSKKRIHLKKKWVIGIIIATIIVIVGAILTIAYLLPKTPSTKDGDITIGATTITQKQLNTYAKAIDDYRVANPEAILEGDSKVIASDDLIMNAALKYYAVKYGQTVSNKEILAEAGIEATSDAEADEMIAALGDTLGFTRIRNENIAYQKKLAPYVLAMKSLFSMETTFDTPYFLGLPVGEVQVAYDSAVARLRTEILPLFNAKQTKEEIAKKADINFFDGSFIYDPSKLIYDSGPVLEASYDETFRADGKYYNNIDDPTGYVRGDVGQLYSMDEKIATLKNVGDYTDVFSAKTGAFVIIRLESKTDGEFNSWQEMLESFKEQYAYDSISKVISDVSYGTQKFFEDTAKIITSIGVEKASAAAGDCGGHEVALVIRSYDESNHVYFGGVRARVTGEPKYSDYCPGFSIDETVTTTHTIGYTCYALEPKYYLISAPGGYIYTGISKPSWAESYINKRTSADVTFRFKRPWHISGSSSITTSTYTPGKTIGWSHTVKNDGPTSLSQNVNYGWQNSNGFSGSGSVGTLPAGFGSGSSRSFTSTHIINQDNVGKTLCRSTYANPGNNDNYQRFVSSPACVYIPYDYVLKPFIKSTDDLVAVEADTAFYVTPWTTNIGPTKSKSTPWQITEIIVKPGYTVPNPLGGSSDQLPCGTYFQSANSTCSNITSNVSGSSGTTVFSETGAWLSGSAITATAVKSGNYDIGTHICYAFSVQPRASSVPVNVANDNQWAHSAPYCLVISKKPKAQIWGGDLSVIGTVQTSTSTKVTDGIFGSWVEYGIFATGKITGTASGSAFVGGLKYIDLGACGYSTLSFSNSGGGSGCDTTVSPSIGDYNIGNYKVTGSIGDIADSFSGISTEISDTEKSFAPSSLENGIYKYKYQSLNPIDPNDFLTLQQSELTPGKTIIIKTDAKVKIIGNQTYSNGPYASISQLSQLIIIAKDIEIADTVTRIDGWLIAKDGLINTCSSVAGEYLAIDANLSINMCNLQLVVNGPVMTKYLYLRRTYGSGLGLASGDPAEIFNLRADTYLWSFARATSSGHIQSVYSTEIPPRF